MKWLAIFFSQLIWWETCSSLKVPKSHMSFQYKNIHEFSLQGFCRRSCKTHVVLRLYFITEIRRQYVYVKLLFKNEGIKYLKLTVGTLHNLYLPTTSCTESEDQNKAGAEEASSAVVALHLQMDWQVKHKQNFLFKCRLLHYSDWPIHSRLQGFIIKPFSVCSCSVENTCWLSIT